MNLKLFFEKIKQPFINIEYYKNAINKTFINSFLVFIGVVFLNAILFATIFTTNTMPTVIRLVNENISNTFKYYPSDLVFNWNGSSLEFNRDNYEVPWPSSITQEDTNTPKSFIFFENSNKSPEDLNITSSDYLLFVNSNNLYYNEGGQESAWISQSLSNFSESPTPITIDKQFIKEITDQILDFNQQNQTTYYVIAYILYIFQFTSGKVWFLMFETILVILVFKLYSMKLTTNQVVKLTMNVMIPTVIINSIADLIYSDINFPLQTITFWILTIYISYQFKNRKREE